MLKKLRKKKFVKRNRFDRKNQRTVNMKRLKEVELFIKFDSEFDSFELID